MDNFYFCGAWGNCGACATLTGTSSPGPATSPFGFAGGYTDSSGLVYLINRYYAPMLRQFISVDPAVATTGTPYAYAGNNPVNWADPSGLMCWQALEFGITSSSRQCWSSGYSRAYRHGLIGFGGCAVYCISLSFQGGTLVVSNGCSGIIGKGLYVGWANEAGHRRNGYQVIASGAYFVGATGGIGGKRYPYTPLVPNDWEVDVQAGFGLAGGVMHSHTLHQFGTVSGCSCQG